MALAASIQESPKDGDYFSFKSESNDPHSKVITPSFSRPRNNMSHNSLSTISIDEHINPKDARRISLPKSQVSFGVISAETDPTPFSEPEIIVPPGPSRHSTSLTVAPAKKKPQTKQKNRLSRNNTTGHQLDPDNISDDFAKELSSRQKAFRRLSRRKVTEDDDDRVLMGTRISEGHRNYILMYNMLTGIRIAVGRVSAKNDRPLVDDDFWAAHKLAFDVYVYKTSSLYCINTVLICSTGDELTPGAKYDFKFKDYAPWVFRGLRERFGIDPADYLVKLHRHTRLLHTNTRYRYH